MPSSLRIARKSYNPPGLPNKSKKIIPLQPQVDRFPAAIWLYATVNQAIICIADGTQPPTSPYGGLMNDFSRQDY